jgi:hypothetical protein
MLGNHFYHRTFRKLVTAFGTMFNNITLVKYDVNENEVERLKVPLSYAQKEKFVVSLMTDPTQDKPIQVQLPRMSFEMLGFVYDPSRKLPSIKRVYSSNPSNSNQLYQNFVPVPYNFSFELGLYTRNIEDLFQIAEQIIPTFTPDFTVSVSLINENGQTVIKDCPITLDNPQFTVEYQGDALTPRYVTSSLQFTMQAYLYGSTQSSSLIRKAITNIYELNGPQEQFSLFLSNGGAGTFTFEEPVFSGGGETWQDSSWRGRVLSWSPVTQRLVLYEVDGELPASGDVVHGLDSGARWTISTASRTDLKLVRSTITPSPNTANSADANVSYIFTTQEFPQIDEDS